MFLLFLGDKYYPMGGWNDFKGSFVTLKEAQEPIYNVGAFGAFDWAHIVDSSTGKIVWKFTR